MQQRVMLIRNVSTNNYGGGEIYQLKLAKELKQHGFSPIIVTNSRKLLLKAKELDYITLKPPYCRQQNWSGWRNVFLFKYWLFQKKLAKWYEIKMKELRPVAVNIQSRDDMIAGTRVAKKLGIRVIWTDHADFKNWVLWNVNVLLKNRIGKRIIQLSSEASNVIFVSKIVKEETEAMICPKMLKNTMVVENGVEDELEKYVHVREEPCSFVYVGRVVEEKGINEMVAAFIRLRKNYPRIKMNIFGCGDDKKLLVVRKADEGICFNGETDKPLEALAKNDIFVLPSYQEGLSLSLVEAAMMQKRIIASNVGGNPEVVIDKKTGLLVPAKNVDKLVEAMEWMLEHREESRKMAQNARRHYEKNFDFKKLFEEKMLPLYNRKKEE